MAQPLPTIAGFWYGSNLSWIEALCIQSYLDNGHEFVLYTAEQIDGVPDGAVIRPASEILWPAPFDLENNDRHRIAVFSDIFRLHLMRKTSSIWVDLDAYCVRPFEFEGPYVFGSTSSGSLPNGVLRLPSESQALTQMLEFVAAENPTQPWRGPRLHRKNRDRSMRGETWGIETLPWGCSGPKALTHFMNKTGEDCQAKPPDAFYPLERQELWKLHAPNIALTEFEGERTYSIHIYGHQKKWLASQNAGLPQTGSYLERICERHSIDPVSRPIIQADWMKP